MKIKSENDELVIKEGEITDKGITIEFKHHIIEISGKNLSILIAGKKSNVKIIDKMLDLPQHTSGIVDKTF